MAEYVTIVDGIVMTSQPLPESFQAADGTWITGFQHMTDDQLAEHGFFKVVMPEISYDPETQDVTYFENVLNEDGKTVSPRYEVIEKADPNPQPLVSQIAPSILELPNIQVSPMKDDFTHIPPEKLKQTVTTLTENPNRLTPDTIAEEI